MPEFCNLHSFPIFAHSKLKMKDFDKYRESTGLLGVTENTYLVTGVLKSENHVYQTVTDTTAASSKTQPVQQKAQRNIPAQRTRRDVRFDGDVKYLQPLSVDRMGLQETTKQTGLELPIRPVNYYNTDWFTLVMVVVLALLASVRFSFANYISSLFQSVVNYSTSSRMFRERNYSILSGAFRLDVLYYAIFSVFTIQVLAFFTIGNHRPGILFYGKTLGLVILYFILKKFIYRLMGIIFKGIPETSEFIFNIDNFNRVTGILLIPVVALLAYYPYEYVIVIVIAGISAVLGLYIFLLGRGVSILFRKQFSILYLFLYLCTLEFLPLLLIFKVVAE